MEIWKTIEGTYGLLEISSNGRFRSNMRDGRILKQQIDNKGYMRVRVTIRRERRQYKTHRAVASAFLPNPHGLPQVNHIDGNKANNCVSNLEWASNEDNAHHAIRTGLWGNVFSASMQTNETRKTPIRSVDAMTGQVRRFESVSEAEHFFNSRHISDALNGKRAKAAGQRFFREVI
jgi:hypothetical protein